MYLIIIAFFLGVVHELKSISQPLDLLQRKTDFFGKPLSPAAAILLRQHSGRCAVPCWRSFLALFWNPALVFWKPNIETCSQETCQSLLLLKQHHREPTTLKPRRLSACSLRPKTDPPMLRSICSHAELGAARTTQWHFWMEWTIHEERRL